METLGRPKRHLYSHGSSDAKAATWRRLKVNIIVIIHNLSQSWELIFEGDKKILTRKTKQKNFNFSFQINAVL